MKFSWRDVLDDSCMGEEDGLLTTAVVLQWALQVAKQKAWMPSGQREAGRLPQHM